MLNLRNAKELERLLRENTEALKENTAALERMMEQTSHNGEDKESSLDEPMPL